MTGGSAILGILFLLSITVVSACLHVIRRALSAVSREGIAYRCAYCSYEVTPTAPDATLRDTHGLPLVRCSECGKLLPPVSVLGPSCAASSAPSVRAVRLASAGLVIVPILVSLFALLLLAQETILWKTDGILTFTPGDVSRPRYTAQLEVHSEQWRGSGLPAGSVKLTISMHADGATSDLREESIEIDVGTRTVIETTLENVLAGEKFDPSLITRLFDESGLVVSAGNSNELTACQLLVELFCLGTGSWGEDVVKATASPIFTRTGGSLVGRDKGYLRIGSTLVPNTYAIPAIAFVVGLVMPLLQVFVTRRIERRYLEIRNAEKDPASSSAHPGTGSST